MAELVTACVCSNLGDAMAIRASLEARGIPAHIDGLHTNSIWGSLGVVEIRIMVSSEDLREARELATEVIEDLSDFDDELDEDEIQAGEGYSPMRRPPAEDLVDYPDDEDDDDDEDALEPAEPMPPRLRPWIRATWKILAGVGLLCIATGQFGRGLICLAFALWAWWGSSDDE